MIITASMIFIIFIILNFFILKTKKDKWSEKIVLFGNLALAITALTLLCLSFYQAYLCILNKNSVEFISFFRPFMLINLYICIVLSFYILINDEMWLKFSFMIKKVIPLFLLFGFVWLMVEISLFNVSESGIQNSNIPYAVLSSSVENIKYYSSAMLLILFFLACLIIAGNLLSEKFSEYFDRKYKYISVLLFLLTIGLIIYAEVFPITSLSYIGKSNIYGAQFGSTQTDSELSMVMFAILGDPYVIFSLAFMTIAVLAKAVGIGGGQMVGNLLASFLPVIILFLMFTQSIPVPPALVRLFNSEWFAFLFYYLMLSMIFVAFSATANLLVRLQKGF